jgi:hypothetical protein
MWAGRVKQEMKRGILPKNALYWILQSILQDAGKLRASCRTLESWSLANVYSKLL